MRFAGLIRYVGKSFTIFPSPPSYIHSWFFNSAKQLRVFQRKFRIPHVNSPKTVINILGNGREYITDTCVQTSAFQDDHAVTGGRRATVEVSPR